MKRTVGFRNVAVREYQELEMTKVRAIIEHRPDDLAAFARAMIAADPGARTGPETCVPWAPLLASALHQSLWASSANSFM
jgi:hypothetical protein